MCFAVGNSDYWGVVPGDKPQACALCCLFLLQDEGTTAAEESTLAAHPHSDGVRRTLPVGLQSGCIYCFSCVAERQFNCWPATTWGILEGWRIVCIFPLPFEVLSVHNIWNNPKQILFRMTKYGCSWVYFVVALPILVADVPNEAQVLEHGTPATPDANLSGLRLLLNGTGKISYRTTDRLLFAYRSTLPKPSGRPQHLLPGLSPLLLPTHPCTPARPKLGYWSLEKLRGFPTVSPPEKSRAHEPFSASLKVIQLCTSCGRRLPFLIYFL